MLGVIAMSAATAAVRPAGGEELAHLAGALAFGLGFVFLVVGRGELFTENFLVPISAVVARRSRPAGVLRLWLVTFLGNYGGVPPLGRDPPPPGGARPTT